MSDINKRIETIPASGQIKLAQENFFFLVNASAAVNVRVENDGIAEALNTVSTCKVRRIAPWKFLRILGTAGTTLEFFIGSCINDKDETDIPLTISSITGAVSVVEAPANVVDDDADVTLSPGDVLSVPQSLLRRRITIGNHPDSGSNLRIQGVGSGDAHGTVLAPGMYIRIDGTYAFDVLNESTNTDDAVVTTLTEF